MIDRDLVALVGFIALFVMMLLRVPIGVAMGLVGLGGFATVVGIDPALNLLATSPLRTVTNYDLSIIPMFVLMGIFATSGGMSRELFSAANAWVGGRRGGLASATIATCAGFSAICGSSVATAATMTKIALPEMRRMGYADSLSTGVIAAGGTLGILIPPSIVMVVYAFITEQDVGQLFIAGVLPGVLAIALHMTAIRLIALTQRDTVPPGQKVSWSEKLRATRGIWAIALVFIAVIGGIYFGFVTAVEAAALGAIATFIIGLVRRRLTWRTTLECLLEALRTSVAIYIILIGAILFGYFLVVTQTPQNVASFLVELGYSPLATLILILVLFLVLGCVLDAMAMIILLVPIFFPVITQMGFDPIWFGVIVVMTVELALITPPVGMNVFVIKSVATDASLGTIFRGVTPFVLMDIVRLALLIAFPAIVLYLPSQM
jgi:C4-dicarboxylate transporter DctM subunit